MSFTMEQYNEALLSVIDKNKRYAIEELQKPTTVYKTEGFKNILYTLMVAPQLQDSQSVLDFLTAESTMVESPLVCSLLPTSVWRLEGRGGRLFVSMAFFGHLHSGIRLSVQFDDTASGNRGAEDSEKVPKSFG